MENKKGDSKLWFKAKNFGWGWYPVSWDGWIITILYIIAIIQPVMQIDEATTSVSDFFINFSISFIVNTIFLLIICYVKGEKPEWRWNGKKYP